MDFIPEIKSGIPIPAAHAGRTTKYDWLFKMKVGDCVDLPDERSVKLVCSAVHNKGIGRNRRKGAGRVKQRAMNENGKTFYRLWRVA
jgi:hypothetical protein